MNILRPLRYDFVGYEIGIDLQSLMNVYAIEKCTMCYVIVEGSYWYAIVKNTIGI